MDETTTPPTPDATPPSPLVNDVEDNKDIAALSYAWVLSVFVYFWKKDSPFVRFHAKQGMALFVLSIVVWMIPVAGRFIELLVLALCVFGFLSAAQGEWKDLPIIGDIAKGRWSHVRQSWRDVVASVAKLWKRVHYSIRKEKEKGSSFTSPTPTPSEPVSMPIPSDQHSQPSPNPNPSPSPNPSPNSPTL